MRDDRRDGHLHTTQQATLVLRRPLASSRQWYRICATAVRSVTLLLVVALSGCSAASSPRPTVTPTATPTSLPQKAATPSGYGSYTFSDWRTAYMDADTRLHIVSLDGKINFTGPTLKGLPGNGDAISSGGFSPNGHSFAYSGAKATLVVVDLVGPRHHVPPFTPHYEIAWSPDSSQLALSDGQGDPCVANLLNGQCALNPSIPNVSLNSIVGWTDATHLAMRFGPPPPAGAPQDTERTGIGVLDVTTWSFRVVATFFATDNPGMGIMDFMLSPDGKEVLNYNRRFRNDPFTPILRTIDLATGAITPLPQLLKMALGDFAWRPGTQQVAASSLYGTTGAARTWLLDLQHDQATLLNIPEGRFPSCWSPDGSHLLLSTGTQFDTSQIGGPFEIDAATIDANGQTTFTVLTKEAMMFPYMGFVRTI